jgi:pimeloyl-ACP methyl ester carboxylesterase
MIAKRAFEARDILVARYGPYVSRGPLLYGGFSQGATLASSVVAAHPGEFDRVIMVEAGHTPLSATGVIYGLKRGGVETAAISCSTGGCATFSKDLVAAARDASFELLTSDGGRRGHVFDGVTMESVGQTIVQMVAADARFSGLPPALREVR